MNRAFLGGCLSIFVLACGGDDSSSPVDAGDSGSTDTSTEGSTTDAGPVTPTVSSWIGTNVGADLPLVDVSAHCQPFNTATPQKDANGYPLAGASGTSSTDLGFQLPTGTYKIAFEGAGTLAVSGIGKVTSAWTTVNGEQRADLQITGTPGAFGNFLTLTITNGANQTVQAIRVLLPGYAYDATPVFTKELLALLRPFRALRFMDWEGTNGNTAVDFTDRALPAAFGASAFGPPLERIAELVNVTGKDAWITVPEHASDAYIQSLAQLMTKQLDFTRIDSARKAQGLVTPFKLIVEDSNETWNGGFSANATYLKAAKLDTTRYTGAYGGAYGPSWMTGNADLMRVGQYHADRLVKIAKAFTTAFGTIGKADVVAPVLSGWALGAANSDVGLRFIKDHYGDPKTLISYVAMAPYFGPEEAETTALPALFTSMTQNIASMDTTFQDFQKLVTEYGLAIVAYEGGQGISGNANLTVKHLAQHDQRMYDAYGTFFNLWKKSFGQALFMHFSLAGTPGVPELVFQYGFWGSIAGVMEDPAACAPNLPTLTGTETVASVVHHCPKYRALAEHVPQ
ncbi:hypothetical protein BH09MYX1_BH09MYX1_13280 [soil metagenome]